MTSQPLTPRWLLLGDVPRTASLLRDAFGGPRRRQVVKALAVPHLVAADGAVALGISPDRGSRCLLARVRSGLLQASWLVAASLSSRVHAGMPWCLTSKRNVRWRLVNLARSADDRHASSATLPLCLHALRLADQNGMELQANVARCAVRLLRAYQRAGFSLVSGNADEYILRRPPVAAHSRWREKKSWRYVLRTGRVGADRWHVRFGAVPSPVLDVGAGDSPLADELTAAGIPAIAVDPQFSLRRPARPFPASVAAVGEALPFRSGTFGTVHASFVIQHSPRPDLLLAELVRVARPDGIVLVHPVWRARRIPRISALGGVAVLPGRPVPPRRQRPSLRISVSEFDVIRDGPAVAVALRPGYIVRAAGRIAMCLLVATRRTTSIGPGSAPCET
jgi:SAM-dependent methyltransferase